MEIHLSSPPALKHSRYLVFCAALLGAHLTALAQVPTNDDDTRETRRGVVGTESSGVYAPSIISDAPEDAEMIPDWTKGTSVVGELKSIRYMAYLTVCLLAAIFGALIWDIGMRCVRGSLVLLAFVMLTGQSQGAEAYVHRQPNNFFRTGVDQVHWQVQFVASGSATPDGTYSLSWNRTPDAGGAQQAGAAITIIVSGGAVTHVNGGAGDTFGSFGDHYNSNTTAGPSPSAFLNDPAGSTTKLITWKKP